MYLLTGVCIRHKPMLYVLCEIICVEYTEYLKTECPEIFAYGITARLLDGR